MNPDEIYEQQSVFIPATEGAGGESDSWGTGFRDTDNIVFKFSICNFYFCICLCLYLYLAERGKTEGGESDSCDILEH